jgi:hypothetical protein
VSVPPDEEDALRRVFAAQVESPPVLDDPAARALRRSRRIRRRRGVLGSGLALLAFATFGGGLVWVQNWRLAQGGAGEMVAVDVLTPTTEAPLATGTASTLPNSTLGARPGVDLFADGYVWTSEGLRISVAERDADVTRAYRVPVGWVLGGGLRARLVRTDGITVELPIGNRWVLSTDGNRVAYAVAGTLRLAALVPSGVLEIASAKAGINTVPVALAGDQVVIGENKVDGTLSRIDRWLPSAPLRPAWKQAALTVYEVPTGGLVGQVPGGGEPCLALFSVRPDGVHRGQGAACELGVRVGVKPEPVVSPNGRWLAVPLPAKVAIYDLGTVFRTPVVAATCGSAAAVDMVWEGPDKLLVADGLAVTRCTGEGAAEQVRLPADLPYDWQFVPTRR